MTKKVIEVIVRGEEQDSIDFSLPRTPAFLFGRLYE